MPSLEELAKNLENYRYYSGYGTFKSNNLPYGQDRPGGGDSRQPFIVRGTDQRWSPSNFDDGLTPFGVVTLASRTAADLTRVTQFLYTSTKGPLFLLKQTGLQRSNPNIKQIDVDSFDKKIIPTQLYNPLGTNTLAQVGLGALGARFTKHGLIPQTESDRNYQNYILKADEEGENRLQNLLSRLGNRDQDTLYKYGGGPGSIFGIGNTTVKRYYKGINGDPISPIVDKKSGFISIPVQNLQKISGDSTFIFKTAYVDVKRISENEDIIFSAYVTGDVDPQQLDNSFFTGDSDNNYNLGSTYDFRAYKNALRSKLSGETGPSLITSNYQQYNIENRIGVARVRKPSERTNYTSSADTADRINAISLYYSNSPIGAGDLQDVNGTVVTAGSIRDIVKFRIKVYDNDRTLDPKGNNYGVYMVFRAYISNIKRTVNPKWDPYKYVGRGESFYAYDGFTEVISINFVIAASTRAEMKPLYQKLNYLISSLAPDYSSAGLMRGSISELTIGDFILYQPGIITSFDMIIDEDSNWEIAMQEPETESGTDTDMHELPQLLKCTMTFVPIYNFLPRKNAEAPFIGIDGYGEKKKEGKQWLKGINSKLKEKK